MSSLYHVMAGILAVCYSAVHNYALAIALLTVVVVAVTTPLTWKSTRGMLAMQMLAPEIKKLQQKYKNDKETLNKEMMALYKENNINPLGGCLPLLPQMVVFFVLYRTIYNLSHKATYPTRAAAVAANCPPPTHAGPSIVQLAANKFSCSAFVPQNVSHTTLLYHNLVASGGHMKVWGFDLTLGVRTAHGSAVVGYWILVALVVGAYYIQTKQMSSRNPAAAAANPQMQTMQKIFPLFFGFISITIQAGVNIYFLVSALCRIGQQSLMYRHDPVLRRHVAQAKAAGPIDVPSTEKRKGFFASLAPPQPAPPRPKPPANRPPPAKPPADAAQPADGSPPVPDTAPAPDTASAPDTAPAPDRSPAADRAPAPDRPQSTWSRLWAVATGAQTTTGTISGRGGAGAARARGGTTGPASPPNLADAGDSDSDSGGSRGGGSTGGSGGSSSPGSASPGSGSPSAAGNGAGQPRSGGGANGSSNGRAGNRQPNAANGSRRSRTKNRSRAKRARRSR